jgi:DNA polymerase III gamma/tau subunit
MLEKNKIIAQNGGLHHAYLIVGTADLLLSEIKKLLIEINGESFGQGNSPDFWERSFQTFGIDDSRALREYQSKKAVSGGGKYFFITADAFTFEAQGALLKTFEEPSADSHFFIFTKSLSLFLPTLLSRCQIVDGEKVEFSEEIKKMAKKFLLVEASERLKMVEKIVEKDAKISAGDFVNCLESLFRENIELSSATPAEILALEELIKINRSLKSRISAPRLYLDHLALVLAKRG